MRGMTALNLDTDHWVMLTLGNMSELVETRPRSSFHERMFYDCIDDAATAYLGIVSRMFEGDERMEEMQAAMWEITDILDAEGVEHEWTGASDAEVHAGDHPCLCIYNDE